MVQIFDELQFGLKPFNISILWGGGCCGGGRREGKRTHNNGEKRIDEEKIEGNNFGLVYYVLVWTKIKIKLY